MAPSNLLFIMSDERNRRVMGCAGHPMIQTPHRDALAARGVRLTDADSNSPIRVPSRASSAAGCSVHQIGFRDNAVPDGGTVPSWAHRLAEAGHVVTSIGKLHSRSGTGNAGFTEEVIPPHVADGEGNLLVLIRDGTTPGKTMWKLAEEARPGDSSYQSYNDLIVEAAVAWLKRRAAVGEGRPWVLFVSLVCPRFPLVSCQEWYNLYSEDAAPRPIRYAEAKHPRHSFTEATRGIAICDEALTPTRVGRAPFARPVRARSPARKRPTRWQGQTTARGSRPSANERL